MPVPFVPHLFCMVIDALPLEEMRVQPPVTLLSIVQAVQDEINLRGWQGNDACFPSGGLFAAKRNNLGWRMWMVGLGACSNGTGNRALAVGFSHTCRAIPLLPAVERGATKQAVHPVGVTPRPECQQVAQCQFGLRLGGGRNGISLPQRPKGRAIVGMHGFL